MGTPSPASTKLISVSRTDTRRRGMIVFGTNRHARMLQLRAAGFQSPRLSVSVRPSLNRWPVVLHEVFQASEHQAPVRFRTLARLVGEIVVLMQRYACLPRSVGGKVHGHDVVCRTPVTPLSGFYEGAPGRRASLAGLLIAKIS